MDLRQLRYFAVIVEEQSISAAAARLHMTQPPLTALVNALEKEIGGRLLDRHARGVRPTEAGRELAAHARRLLADLDTTLETVRALGRGATGVLSVAIVPSASWQLMPRLLAEFRGRHPDVHVTLDEIGGPVPTIEAVRRRQVEAAIVYTTDPRRLVSGYARDMEATVIRREPMVLIVPQGDGDTGVPQGDGDTGVVRLSHDQLADRVWVTTSTPPSYPGLNQALRSYWQRAGITPRVRTVGSLGIARTFVQAGLGVAAVNQSTITGLPASIVPATPPGSLGELHAVVLHLSHEAPSVPLQSFLAIAARGVALPALESA